ncbi:ankyrin repeat domain-containing protein [candidate division KSB1 bacterium]
MKIQLNNNGIILQNLSLRILLLILISIAVAASAQNIHQAADTGDFNSVKKLLENDPELINSRDESKATPLYYAAWRGHLDIVKLLIDKGANVNIRQQYGFTPIGRAISSDHNEIARFLIDNGAALNMKGIGGRTPLYWSVQKRNKYLVKYILDRKPDVNAANFNRSVPLHMAVYWGDREAVEMLINAGAAINVLDKNNKSPLIIAVETGNDPVVELLISKGAGVNVKDDITGKTELHIASLKGYYKVVNILLKMNFDINAEDNDGNTPLYYAVRYGHKKIADLLRSNGAKEDNTGGNSGFTGILNRNLNENEACVWYLGHCGWAVKTKNHFLIFDYWEQWKKPDEPSLTNGFIDPEEIKDLNVTVFVTHNHTDHFDSVIVNWGKRLKNVKYIFGWKGKNDKRHFYIPGNQHSKFADIEVITINYNDGEVPGVSYLVKVDGLSIFHSGDHILNNLETEFFRKYVKKFDIHFQVQQGAQYAESQFPVFETFLPGILCPMHSGGREYLYKEFAEKISESNLNLKVFAPEHKGDKFFYKEGNTEIF